MAQLINSIKLDSVKLLASHFDLIDPDGAAEGGSVGFACSVSVPKNQEDNDLRLVFMAEVEGFREPSGDGPRQELFKIEEQILTVFSFNNKEYFLNAPEHVRVNLCLSLVYQVLREDICRILVRAGLGQIDIPYHFTQPQKE